MDQKTALEVPQYIATLCLKATNNVTCQDKDRTFDSVIAGFVGKVAMPS